jgi:hypothetical protein
MILLKQDFWSILGHMTYVASGLCWRRVSKTITKLMPVANGNTTQDAADFTPAPRNRMEVILNFLPSW